MATVDRRAWIITLAAAAILMVTMGTRQSLGLFVSPLNTTTGLGIVTISFALAVGQFTWGAVQPIAGAIADRHGPAPVLIGGIVLLAIGTALTPFMGSGAGLVIALGLLSQIGSGASSFAVLIGAAAQRLPDEARGTASGVINAGGSFGQFVFAPVSQKLIQALGWMGAMWSLAVIALAALPLIGILTKGHRPPPKLASGQGGAWRAIKDSMNDRSYLLLHAGFFTCGFHIAFLVTHMPGEVELCGLPATVASWSLAIVGLTNIAGSLLAGASVSRFRSKHILAVMYASRAVLIALYLVAPKTPLTFYLFAAGLGRHVALDGAAHRRHRGQALRHPLPRHALRAHALLTPDRRLPRRLPGRHRLHRLRRLPVDVVRGHGARGGRGTREPADQGGCPGAQTCGRVAACDPPNALW